MKRAGDRVVTGDIVAEIETDKTTFEVTSPVDGTVLATFFEEGALVPVFTTIFVIGSPGESVDGFMPVQQGRGTSQSAIGTERPNRETGVADLEPAKPRTSTTSNRPATAFSPRASRLAAQLGLQSADITGSGPRGRVLENDVRRASRSRSLAPRTAATEPRTTNGEQRTASRGPRIANGEPRMVGLRAAIARRMRESLASTAQYTLNTSADATGLLAVRARVKSTASEGVPDVTINELITFCTILALLDLPALNAEYLDGEIVRHSEVHIAFAVDTPRGLLAPVVRHAHDLSIGELSRRMKQLAAQAVDGTIAPDDLTGATFTISNLGSLGVESFTPLINPPQVAILGVDTITLRPVRRQGLRVPLRLRETSARRAVAFAESIEFVDSIGLSLTCDHQVIDGAPGARFLQLLRQKIETVESLVEM